MNNSNKNNKVQNVKCHVKLHQMMLIIAKYDTLNLLDSSRKEQGGGGYKLREVLAQGWPFRAPAHV